MNMPGFVADRSLVTGSYGHRFAPSAHRMHAGASSAELLVRPTLQEVGEDSGPAAIADCFERCQAEGLTREQCRPRCRPFRPFVPEGATIDTYINVYGCRAGAHAWRTACYANPLMYVPNLIGWLFTGTAACDYVYNDHIARCGSV